MCLFLFFPDVKTFPLQESRSWDCFCFGCQKVIHPITWMGALLGNYSLFRHHSANHFGDANKHWKPCRFVWWGKAEVFQLKMGCSSFSDGQPGWSRGCHWSLISSVASSSSCKVGPYSIVKICQNTMKILQHGNFDIFWWLQSNLAIVGHCHSCSRSHGQAQVTSGLLGWPEDFKSIVKVQRRPITQVLEGNGAKKGFTNPKLWPP